jgi:tetratricopeptide (TPR) repeat protein
MKFAYLFCLLALLTPAGAAESSNSPKPTTAKPANAKPATAKPPVTKPRTAEELIAQAYGDNKNNPEYFLGSANLLWKLSKRETTSSKPAGPGDIVLADPATGKPIGSVRTSDPALQRKAIALLSEAHSRFPYRLDIGVQLAVLQFEMKEQTKSLDTLSDILKYAPKNEGKLQWTGGRALPDSPQNFVPKLMQGLAAGFRGEKTKDGYELCRKLCEKTIQAYPDSPLGYITMGGLYNDMGDKKATIKYLHLAYQKAPKDAFVLLVLGKTYEQNGDTANARKCFERVITMAPSEEIKSAATEALAAIRN